MSAGVSYSGRSSASSAKWTIRGLDIEVRFGVVPGVPRGFQVGAAAYLMLLLSGFCPAGFWVSMVGRMPRACGLSVSRRGG